MRALKVYEAIDFTREGDPLDRLNIGRKSRSPLLRALKFMNTGKMQEQLDGEATNDWLKGNPSLCKALNYDPNNPKEVFEWTNIWTIETDSYCEEYAPDDVDYEVLDNEFIPTGKYWGVSKPGEYDIREGVIKGTNIKVIKYTGSGTSGYAMRKEWL
jgi:hypothetical protein